MLALTAENAATERGQNPHRGRTGISASDRAAVSRFFRRRRSDTARSVVARARSGHDACVSDDPLRFYDGEWFTIGGSEFDFLAIDDKGQVAVFSHGGWGPIPRAIVDRWEQAIKAVEATERLPVTTTAQEAPGGPDDYSSWWLTKVERGLFAYDWRNTYGPYQLTRSPTRQSTSMRRRACRVTAVWSYSAPTSR